MKKRLLSSVMIATMALSLLPTCRVENGDVGSRS